MEIGNVKKENKKIYPVEFDILYFLYNNEKKRGRMIINYNNGEKLTKIILREPIGKIRENEIEFKKGIDAVAENLTNNLLNSNSHFIGVNYKEEYKKFNKNTMFIFQKREISAKDYKLSVYGSVEFKEFN